MRQTDDGRWLVLRASYCNLLAANGPKCPTSR
jgi:hypothetical protein